MQKWTSPVHGIASLYCSMSSRQTVCGSLQSEFLLLESQRGCLSLGSGARVPRRLGDVLDAMQDFECADVRDKFYGVLNLVNWGSAKRPDPDYSKDPFEVAVMVLKLYLATESRAPLSGATMNWACCLCELFKVSLDHGDMRRAIKSRNARSAMPRSSENGINVFSQGSSIDEMLCVEDSLRVPHRIRNTWYGTRLTRDAPSWSHPETGTKETTLSLHSHAQFGMVIDQQGHLLGLAPAETKVGDWFLMSSHANKSFQNALGLIVRFLNISGSIIYTETDTNAPFGTYSIVGQALINPGYDKLTRLAISIDSVRMVMMGNVVKGWWSQRLTDGIVNVVSESGS
jgi:hypothetical protein